MMTHGKQLASRKPLGLLCMIVFASQHSFGEAESDVEKAESTSLLQVRVSTEETAPEASRTGLQEEIMRKALSELDMPSKKELWWNLANDLNKHDGFPIRKGGETGLRHTIDLWTQQVAEGLATKQIKKQRCAETGDGHFLRKMFGKVCESVLITDKYNAAADVKLDLDLPPAKAPESIRAAHDTVDLLVSNQVFEHLLRPSVGIANLNALLKVGGRLIFSTPFVVQDHRSPNDYFRYTVMGIRKLLQCAGFDVQELYGKGDRLESIAYLAGAPSAMLDLHDITADCDAKTTDDCANQVYSGVAAVGLKKEHRTLQEINDCFG